MNGTGISDVGKINRSYGAAEDRLHEVVRRLRSDCDKHVKENIYYRGGGTHVVRSAVFDAVLLLVICSRRSLSCILRSKLAFVPAAVTDVFKLLFEESNILSSLVLLLLIAAFLLCAYQTGIKIYNQKLASYAKRIDKVEQEILSRLSVLDNVRQEMLHAAAENQECTISTDNRIGEEIIRIRNGFTGTKQKASLIKKYISIGASAASFIVLLVFILFRVRGNLSISINGGMTAAVLYIAAAAVVNLTQFCAGEYMGKFSKAIGAAMAVIYGLSVSVALKDVLVFSDSELYISGMPDFLEKAYIAIPAMQVFGIILTVLLSHYGLEREKWRDGFSVSMRYGSKNAGNPTTLICRGSVALALALLMCRLCAGGWKIVSLFAVPVLWYASNTIMKPRGSYLYTFWGRGRAIANEFVMAAMAITTIICSRSKGMLNEDELLAWGAAFALSFAFALAARMVNTYVYV